MDNLANDIVKALQGYTKEIARDVAKVTDDTSKTVIQELKSTSPRRKTKGGKYASGWTKKKTDTGYIVHNKTYQLTHLLEKGHVKRGGTGRVKAIPHIKPVEDKLIKEYEKKIIDVIKR